MNRFASLPRPILYIIGIVLVILIGAASYIVGSNAIGKNDSGAANKECPYTQDDLDAIFKKFNDRESVYKVKPGETGVSAPLDRDAIYALEGECVDVGLEKAYQLGIRSLRDLTDCWPKCIVTAEYLDTRFNYVIEDRRLSEAYNG